MDLAEIAHRIRIHELINRYTDAIVRLDVEAFGACWTEDAEWTIFGQTLKGRQACLDFYLPLVEPTDHVRHIAHSPQLRISDETAEGRWHVTETVHQIGGDGLLILGVYNDVYALEDGSWRFAKRRLDPIYQGPFAMDAAGLAALPPEANKPF